jgi:hypothetical protein
MVSEIAVLSGTSTCICYICPRLSTYLGIRMITCMPVQRHRLQTTLRTEILGQIALCNNGTTLGVVR